MEPKKQKNPYQTHRKGSDLWFAEVGGGGDEGKEEVVEGGQKVPTSGYTINKSQE